MACDKFNSIKNWWHNSNYMSHEILSLYSIKVASGKFKASVENTLCLK